MTKAKKGTKENPVTITDLKKATAAIKNLVKREYKIIEAKVKDDFCDYRYEITEGVGIHDIHGVKGKAGYVRDSLKTAFAAMNIHLAIVDDIFKNAGIEFDDLESMAGHPLTMLYTVTAFTLKGDEDNLTVSLIGNRYVSMGGRMELKTDDIAIDELSSYKWKNELKTAAMDAANEVAMYKEGNYTPVAEEEPEEDARQLKITDVTVSAGADEDDLDFEGSKV
jgi:hypothetical protein